MLCPPDGCSSKTLMQGLKLSFPFIYFHFTCLSVCLHMRAPCECLVPEEVRRGHQILRNWLIHIFVFETNSWCVAHSELELIILLPQLPECWLITGGYPHIQALVCILNVPQRPGY